MADDVDVASLLYEGGKLYVGTFSEGMKVVGDDGILKDFGTVSLKVPVWAILKDGEGRLVVGSDGEGLFYFDLESGKSSPIIWQTIWTGRPFRGTRSVTFVLT